MYRELIVINGCNGAKKQLAREWAGGVQGSDNRPELNLGERRREVQLDRSSRMCTQVDKMLVKSGARKRINEFVHSVTTVLADDTW